MVYSDWITAWLKAKEGKIKTSSFSNYTTLIETHIIPLLGNLQVEEIDEDLVQDVVDSLEQHGNKRTGDNLAPKSTKEIVRLITSSVKSYCKKNKLAVPDFDELEFSKKDGSTPEVFTTLEQKKLLNAIIKSRSLKAVGVALGLYEGMRIGEICALKWDNINFEEHIIEVQTTIQRIYFKDSTSETRSRLHEDTPKTMNSNRVIPFGSMMVFLFKAIMPSDIKGNYVLTGTEKPMEPKTLRTFYYKMLKDNDIKQRKFHALRHTFGTKCITCKVDPATLCKLMGHANPSITMRLYCHPGLDDLKRAINDVDPLGLKVGNVIDDIKIGDEDNQG